MFPVNLVIVSGENEGVPEKNYKSEKGLVKMLKLVIVYDKMKMWLRKFTSPRKV